MLPILMVGKWLRPLRSLSKLLSEADAAPQLAAGLALGMVIGLLPKGNLIAGVLTVALLVVRVNLTAAMAGASLFSLIGMLLDPLTGRIGAALLGWGPLQSTWTCLYGLPLVPWTRFNNTVVLGSLVLGLALAGPVFWGAWTAIERYRPWLLKKIEDFRIARRPDMAQNLANGNSL